MRNLLARILAHSCACTCPLCRLLGIGGDYACTCERCAPIPNPED